MSSARILVVDDEPALVSLCADLLIEAGYQAQPAYGARQALACLERERFNLLLLDLEMNGVDGLTLLRRAGELQTDVMAVIMTSYVTKEEAFAAVQAGARFFLSKPFDPEELLQAVGRALATGQPQAAAASGPV